MLPTEKAPKFYEVNSQQFIAIDAIASVSDFGWDVQVTLVNNQTYRVDGRDRESFLAIIRAQSARS